MPVKPNIGVSPSGKAQDFDSCIRWFESSHSCLRKSHELGLFFCFGEGAFPVFRSQLTFNSHRISILFLTYQNSHYKTALFCNPKCSVYRFGRFRILCL